MNPIESNLNPTIHTILSKSVPSENKSNNRDKGVSVQVISVHLKRAGTKSCRKITFGSRFGAPRRMAGVMVALPSSTYGSFSSPTNIAVVGAGVVGLSMACVQAPILTPSLTLTLNPNADIP